MNFYGNAGEWYCPAARNTKLLGKRIYAEKTTATEKQITQAVPEFDQIKKREEDELMVIADALNE